MKFLIINIYYAYNFSQFLNNTTYFLHTIPIFDYLSACLKTRSHVNLKS